MARQPFLPTYTGKGWAIGMGMAAQKPELLNLIGECATIWPFVEHQMAMCLGLIMGSNTGPSLAVFSTLRTGRNQRDAVTAAASVVLNEQDQDLVAACWSVFGTAEKMRNDIVHGQWGISEEIPDGLLWVEAKYHSQWNTSMIAAPGTPLALAHADLARYFFVYTKRDFEEAINFIKGAWQIAMDLTVYLGRSANAKETRDVLYFQLSKKPLVRTALVRLSERKNKKSALQ